VEIEYDTGSKRKIKWSDIENTQYTMLQHYNLILKSGESIAIADWRTPNTLILDGLIQNLISFYTHEKVTHGIFIDAKNRLVGRGITFTVNTNLLTKKKRHLWIYLGLSLFGLVLLVPVIWYRLITLETALWLKGGLIAFGFFISLGVYINTV